MSYAIINVNKNANLCFSHIADASHNHQESINGFTTLRGAAGASGLTGFRQAHLAPCH